MNINSIGYNPFVYKKQIKNHFKGTFIKQNLCDSVHFSGTKDKKDITPKDTGIKIGKEMLKLAQTGELNKKNISLLMNANSEKGIEVFDVKECKNLPKTMTNILAYMQPYYDENCNFLCAELYLQNFETIKTIEQQCDYIANNAHEFTHVLQRNKSKDMNGVRKYFNDIEKYQIISCIGFNILDEIFNFQTKEVKKDRNRNEQIIKEINEGNFNFKEHATNIDIGTQLINIGYSIAMQKGYDIEKTQKALFEWIYNTARDEEEAYKVTIAVLDECKQPNQETKTKRILAKEVYKYIADELEPIIEYINK